MTYQEWIKNSPYATQQGAYGQCKDATKEMAAAFPELTRVRGHYYCHIWGEREHWWCETPDGKIVDPTKAQFPSGGFGEYEPWDESQPEPTGMCPNCSGYCYNGETCCSAECHDAYVAYCMLPWGL